MSFRPVRSWRGESVRHRWGAGDLHPTVTLPHTATIIGPAWIGANTEIRPGAFIRGNVIVGEHCVLGNSCEFKNCIIFDACEVPHFNYVGDAILGHKAHLDLVLHQTLLESLQVLRLLQTRW